MDNFIAQLVVILKYFCALVACLGAFSALIIAVIVIIGGLWGVIECVHQEIKMELNKDESKD